jgi:hypothetical protein
MSTAPGGITIANAPGTGVADDKAIYSFMPEIVEFYTGESRCCPTSRPGAAPTRTACLCARQSGRAGGQGSPRFGRLRHADRADLVEARDRRLPRKADGRPDNYIAQPTLALSTCPIYTAKGLAPRHVDLRPFVLVSPEGIDITPAGSRGWRSRRDRWWSIPARGRHQGYLGAEGLMRGRIALTSHARPHRQRPVLDVPLSRAGREHRAPARSGAAHGADPRSGDRRGRNGAR